MHIHFRETSPQLSLSTGTLNSDASRKAVRKGVETPSGTEVLSA